MIASRASGTQEVLTAAVVCGTGEVLRPQQTLRPEPTVRRLMSVGRDVRSWPDPGHFALPLPLRNVRSVRLRDLVATGLPVGVDALQLSVRNLEPDVRAAYGAGTPSLDRPFAVLPVRDGRCAFDRRSHQYAFEPTDQPRLLQVEVRLADLDGATLPADAVEVELEFDAD